VGGRGERGRSVGTPNAIGGGRDAFAVCASRGCAVPGRARAGGARTSRSSPPPSARPCRSREDSRAPRKTNRQSMSRFARRRWRPGITHLRRGKRGAAQDRGAHGVSAGLHDTLHCSFLGLCDAECERAAIRRASRVRVFPETKHRDTGSRGDGVHSPFMGTRRHGGAVLCVRSN
jgi:hypothetical protein